MTRPARRMPTMAKIVAHLGLSEPHCFKCRTCFTDWTYLERAHVIDRWGGGLDHVANLRPLCRTCHRLQPVFLNGDEAEALEWFNTTGSSLAAIAQRVLDELELAERAS